MSKNILFDFDGTLADTLQLALEYGNQNKERFSANKINREEFRERSLKEALSYIGISTLDLARFVMELKSFMRKNLEQVSLFPGVSELIQSLKKANHKLYVVSSNSKEAIETILIRESLANCFEEIYSDSSIFGKHLVLKRIGKQIDLSPKNAIYIGDEVRDFVACQKIKLPMIAVDWGWDNRARLEKSAIPLIVSDPNELLAKI